MNTKSYEKLMNYTPMIKRLIGVTIMAFACVWALSIEAMDLIRELGCLAPAGVASSNAHAPFVAYSRVRA